MKPFFRNLITCIPVLLAGCDDGVSPSQGRFDRGEIYDYDLTKCYCCSGYMITINSKAYKFTDNEVTGPNPLNNIDVKFPVYVYLKWSASPGTCKERILVSELRLTRAR